MNDVLFLKLVIGLLVAVLLWQIYQLQRAGRSVGRSRRGREYDQALLRDHRGRVACIGCLTFIIIVMLEGMIHASPNPHAVNPVIFGLHLTVDILIIGISVAMVSRYTGVFSPKVHRALAYAVIACFLVSAGTGTWMLIQIPQ